jgi:deoxycytidylate deaminase
VVIEESYPDELSQKMLKEAGVEILVLKNKKTRRRK